MAVSCTRYFCPLEYNKSNLGILSVWIVLLGIQLCTDPDRNEDQYGTCTDASVYRNDYNSHCGMYTDEAGKPRTGISGKELFPRGTIMGKARMTHTYYMYASIDKKSIYPYNQ